jgi:hypothetical protein
MNSDSTAITATCGSANSITGFGGEPDHHLRVAPAARQRQQHGDEHRQRQQHRQRAEREEADEGEYGVGRDLAARRVAEQADQARGQGDREEGHEHRARESRELPQQRAMKDHAINFRYGI